MRKISFALVILFVLSLVCVMGCKQQTATPTTPSAAQPAVKK